MPSTLRKALTTVKTRTIVASAALGGFLTVALGAFAAHGLSTRIDVHAIDVFRTGAHYQGLHSLALLGLAALQPRGTSVAGTSVVFWAFVVGMVVFCGSLYALALTGIGFLGAITPIGGVCFLCGWLALARLAWRLD